MQPRPKVTICGSFTRGTAGLADVFLELEVTGCRVLSPLTLQFTNSEDSFAKLASEQSLTPAEIEKFHLRAIAESDFVWLHSPAGYVGTSGAFELGYAYSLGVPVFTAQLPSDVMLQAFTKVTPSVFTALKMITTRFHSS